MLPQIYVAPDLANQQSSWAIEIGYPDNRWTAEIKLEEDTSGKTEEFIEENYQLDMEVDYNAYLFLDFKSCKDYFLAAQAH